MPAARLPHGKVITCDGCGEPVEEVLPEMLHPAPPGLYSGVGIQYIVCAPLPDGTRPCLALARLADAIHLHECADCRRALGPRLDSVLAELTKEN